MFGRAIFVAAAALFAATLCARPAHAEPISELIPRLIEQGGWLKAHYPGQQKEHPSPFAPVESAETPSNVLGDGLRVALVARDWSQSYSLTEGKRLLFDRVRLIRSSRMAMTRIRMSGGVVLPYADVGFGQWRADTDLVPWLKSDAELAGQVALGVEVHLAKRCTFAWDLEETKIYGDTSRVPASRLMASFAALRAEF